MWDKIIYPFLSFNVATVEVWEWISNFIPHFTGACDCLFIMELKLIHVGKRGPSWCLTHWSQWRMDIWVIVVLNTTERLVTYLVPTRFSCRCRLLMGDKKDLHQSLSQITNILSKKPVSKSSTTLKKMRLKMRVDTKAPSYRHRNSHCEDKKVSRQHYLFNRNPYA